MKQKILLPTDFSANAWQAIKYATELYKKDSCVFYLLNVFSIDNTLGSIIKQNSEKKTFETQQAKSKEGLTKIMEMLTLNNVDYSKHHFRTLSVPGSALNVIIDVVEQKDIEMIIMGSKGATGSKNIAYGSTAIYVMEKARNCPVLVVPEKAKHNLPKEIVFPTSYKTHYKRRELNTLVSIAKKCSAKIAILHISNEESLNDNQKEHKEMLKEIFEEVAHTFHELSNQSLESAVRIFIESRNSDMVAFINKKHALLGSVLTQPLVKGMGFYSRVPILVMHDLRN